MPVTSRFSIKSTIALIAVGFLALFGIVGMTIWLGERAQIYFNEVIEARDTRGSAVDLRNAVQTAESSQRGFLVTGNEIYLAPYGTAKSLAQRQLDALRGISRASRKRVGSVSGSTTIIAEKFAEMDRTIALKRDAPGRRGSRASSAPIAARR